MNRLSLAFWLASWFWSLTASFAAPPPPPPVVHAVLFYTPSCGHCHYVITEVLPPLIEKHGDQLAMIGVDITQPDGYALYENATQVYQVDSYGVPLLIVGDTYLVGSADIPEKFPGLIEQYLSQGGIDWPPIPGLAEAVANVEATVAAQATTAAAQPPTITPASSEKPMQASNWEATAQAEVLPIFGSASTKATPTPGVGIIFVNDKTGRMDSSLGARFTNDLVGNSLAVMVLIGMVLSVAGALPAVRRLSAASLLQSWVWLIPLLCILGLGVAGYLAYVETTQAQAVCGPVGDCNTVQQSEYARLFGILPIGVLGMVGYVFMLIAWGVMRWSSPRLTAIASLALFGMTTCGVLFSIYLTFLEPFVIGATCAWCLTSAILMTVLFWLSLVPADSAMTYLRNGEKFKFN